MVCCVSFFLWLIVCKFSVTWCWRAYKCYLHYINFFFNYRITMVLLIKYPEKIVISEIVNWTDLEVLQKRVHLSMFILLYSANIFFNIKGLKKKIIFRFFSLICVWGFIIVHIFYRIIIKFITFIYLLKKKSLYKMQCLFNTNWPTLCCPGCDNIKYS